MRLLTAACAVAWLGLGAMGAWAQDQMDAFPFDETPPPLPMSADECSIQASKPVMPDPATSTLADAEAAFAQVQVFQQLQAEYRKCLNQVIDNQEVNRSVKKHALGLFNKSVDEETAIVTAWGEFYKAFKENNKDG